MTGDTSSLSPTRRHVLAKVLIGAAVAPVAARAHATYRAPEPYRWPGAARGAVSLTYDDGLNSQLEHALPQLQAAGLKATFFLTKENMEARLDDWVAVARLGHEVEDHTATHPCELRPFTPARFEAEQLAPMERFLDSNFPPGGPRVFAYPCGYIGLGGGGRRRREERYSRLLDQTFVAARTTAGPPNDPRLTRANRFHLSGFEPTYEADDAHPALTYLNAAMRRGHWAILVFHEVLPRRIGEGDTSLGVHQQVLDMIRRESLWCAPMGEVYRHVAGGRDEAPATAFGGPARTNRAGG